MLRFSIREILLLTAVVAIAAAWWVDHRKLSDELVLHSSSLFKWQHRAESLKGYLETRFAAKVTFYDETAATGVEIELEAVSEPVALQAMS